MSHVVLLHPCVTVPPSYLNLDLLFTLNVFCYLTFIFLSAEDAVFDASQYAFFGNQVSEEIELGGLEDEEYDFLPVEYNGEEFLLDREEVTFFLSFWF